MRIPKIFLSSKSDNFKSFKPYFESINWLVKVFYSSSFFGEFLFLILSHTEISTDFYPWVPAVHFAPSSPCNRHSPKIGPRWRTPKKTWLHIPLLMDCTQNRDQKCSEEYLEMISLRRTWIIFFCKIEYKSIDITCDIQVFSVCSIFIRG